MKGPALVVFFFLFSYTHYIHTSYTNSARARARSWETTTIYGQLTISTWSREHLLLEALGPRKPNFFCKSNPSGQYQNFPDR
ncbi:hypothetical protein OPQ81_003270 [Rhizoctonia solani]|nr:hypothetical protein OPQ81_003270 [Rhizoctonia solani]